MCSSVRPTLSIRPSILNSPYINIDTVNYRLPSHKTWRADYHDDRSALLSNDGGHLILYPFLVFCSFVEISYN